MRFLHITGQTRSATFCEMFIKSTLQQLRCPPPCSAERLLPSARIAPRFVATFYAFFQRLRRRLLFQVQDKCDSIKPCHAPNTAKHAAVPRNLPLPPSLPLSHSHTDAKQKIAKLNISRVFYLACFCCCCCCTCPSRLIVHRESELASDAVRPSTPLPMPHTHTHTGGTGGSRLQ